MDLESLDKPNANTAAKEEMILRTDTDHAPWTTIKSNDKSVHVSTRCGLPLAGRLRGQGPTAVGLPDPALVMRGRDAVGE